MKEILIIAALVKIIADLHKIFGRERYIKGLKSALKKFINGLDVVSNSKELLYIYRTIIILTLAVSLLLGFLTGVLNVLKGELLIGFIAFGLIATCSILNAYFNWKLSARN
jgi:hypothetical protein